jgi:hypothetical protein
MGDRRARRRRAPGPRPITVPRHQAVFTVRASPNVHPLMERRLPGARPGSMGHRRGAPASFVAGRGNGPSRSEPDRPRTRPAGAPGAPWDRDRSAVSVVRRGPGSPRDGRRTTRRSSQRTRARPSASRARARTRHTSSTPIRAAQGRRIDLANRAHARSPFPRERRSRRRTAAATRASGAP